jgi:hypothetical protein
VMLKVLETIYSLPFFYGALAGTVVWKAYCLAKARLLDRHNPLPDGQRHSTRRMSRQWLAGLAAALSLGYVLLVTARSEEHTHQLNREVERCWAESYRNTNAQIEINQQNDIITRQQLELQREYDRDTSQFWKSLVSPPGDLAHQDVNSPARQDWGLQLSVKYQAQIDQLGAQFDDLVNQRHDLDVKRENNKLPETTCGK